MEVIFYSWNERPSSSNITGTPTDSLKVILIPYSPFIEKTFCYFEHEMAPNLSIVSSSLLSEWGHLLLRLLSFLLASHRIYVQDEQQSLFSFIALFPSDHTGNDESILLFPWITPWCTYRINYMNTQFYMYVTFACIVNNKEEEWVWTFLYLTVSQDASAHLATCAHMVVLSHPSVALARSRIHLDSRLVTFAQRVIKKNEHLSTHICRQ